MGNEKTDCDIIPDTPTHMVINLSYSQATVDSEMYTGDDWSLTKVENRM